MAALNFKNDYEPGPCGYSSCFVIASCVQNTNLSINFFLLDIFPDNEKIYKSEKKAKFILNSIYLMYLIII